MIGEGRGYSMPEIQVSAMTFGPYALARLDGRSVMVPNAAPGDRLEVTIRSRRRDFSIASIERVIAPGPDRRTPPCPYLPRCGGCDWQQLDYRAQLRAKAELIAAGLRRAIDLEIDPADLIEPAPEEFGYRSRIRLQVGREGRLGFFRLGSNELVEIDRCLVAAPSLKLPSALTAALWRNLEEIEVVTSSGREVLIAHMRKPPTPQEIERARGVCERDESIQGVVMKSGAARNVIGDPVIGITIESGLDLKVDADLFSQVNHAQNRKLVAAVMEMASIGPAPAVEVLDLFCGAGNLSLPAARRGATVTGIDADELAVAAAQRNARALGLSNTKFVAGKAAETVNFLIRARYRPAVVILDPPRTGAAELMEAIVKMRPHAVIYVSCDIATLARDLRILTAARYRAERIRAFDFFPNTHHAEIAAHLLLT
jgi:23S rRNA (uracil1939-C5)-methyltransferase